MRGRTNVMQRKEPTINGQIKNFIVKSGNVIEKGDFVSYTLQTDKKTREIVGGFLDKKKYADNVYIGVTRKYVSGAYVYSVRIVNVTDDFVVTDTLDFNTVPYFDIDEQGRVYVGNETTVSVYNIVDLRFSLIDSVTTTKSITGVLRLNSDGQFGVLTKENTAASGSRIIYSVYLQIITVQSGEVTLSVEENILSNLSTMSYTESDLYTGYLSDDTFVVFWQQRYTSGSYGFVFAEKCQYLNNVFSSVRQTVSNISSGSYHLDEVRFNSGLVQLYVYNDYRNWFYLSEGELTVVDELKNTSSGGAILIHPCDEEYYLYEYQGKARLYKWNSANKTISKGQEVSFASGVVEALKRSNSQVILYNNDSTPNVAMSIIDVETLNISLGYFGNIVESYNDTFTVGFAKTGGSGGDTIQVYVPQGS